jgi:hypothetical protein
LGHNHNECPN